MNKSQYRSLILVLLALLYLNACAVTVYNWQDIPDQEAINQQSKEENIEQYKKYAIKELKQTRRGHSIGFSTYLKPEKTYDFYTYAPVIYQYTPESEELFHEALDWEQFQNLAYMGYIFAAFGSAIYSGTSIGNQFAELIINTENTAITSDELWNSLLFAALTYVGITLAYLGVHTYLVSQEMDQYEKIRTRYNADLLRAFRLNALDVSDLEDLESVHVGF